jgi:hypothetical protein
MIKPAAYCSRVMGTPFLLAGNPLALQRSCCPIHPIKYQRPSQFITRWAIKTRAVNISKQVCCTPLPVWGGQFKAQVNPIGLAFLGDSVWSVSYTCSQLDIPDIITPFPKQRYMPRMLLCGFSYPCAAVASVSLCSCSCTCCSLQLYLRRHFLTPPKHPQLYQSSVRAWVSAETQVGKPAKLTHMRTSRFLAVRQCLVFLRN